jgi:hypothetical protein
LTRDYGRRIALGGIIAPTAMPLPFSAFGETMEAEEAIAKRQSDGASG